MNTHSSLPPPSLSPFLTRRNEISEKLGRGSNLKKFFFEGGGPKRRGRGNAKVIGRWDFYIFIFSQLAMMVTDTVFRKSNFENILRNSGPCYF